MRIDAGAGDAVLGEAFSTATARAAVESRMATRAWAPSDTGTCARTLRIAGAASAVNLAATARTFVPVKAGAAEMAVLA